MNTLVDSELLTVTFVAEACGGCSEDVIVRMLQDRLLPGMNLGGSWFIPRAAFLHVVNSAALAHLRTDAYIGQAASPQAGASVRQFPPKPGLVPVPDSPR